MSTHNIHFLGNKNSLYLNTLYWSCDDDDDDDDEFQFNDTSEIIRFSCLQWYISVICGHDGLVFYFSFNII